MSLRSSIRSWLSVTFRVCVSCGLLVFLIQSIDTTELDFSDLPLSGLDVVTVVMLLCLGAVSNAFRWKLILVRCGHVISSFEAVRLFFVGLFFSQALPTSIGGDAVRGYYLTKLGVSVEDAVKSVLIDRLSGLFCLLILSGSGLFLLLLLNVSFQLVVVFGVLVLASSIGFVFLVSLDLLPLFTVPTWISQARGMSRSARSILFNQSEYWIFTLSLIGQALSIQAFITLGSAMNISIEFYIWWALIPSVLIATIIPISLAGWGVREGLIVYSLNAFAVDSERALIVAILFGFAQVIRALPGGVSWLLDSRNGK